MIIDVPKISSEGSRYKGAEPVAILEGVLDENNTPVTDIAYDFFVQNVSGEVIVNGSLECMFQRECVKCAGFFSTKVADSSFLRAYEISPEQEAVDVTEDIREQLLVLLPPFPVCSVECKGLCPVCGINLNKGTCECTTASLDDRWDVLDHINKKDD